MSISQSEVRPVSPRVLALPSWLAVLLGAALALVLAVLVAGPALRELVPRLGAWLPLVLALALLCLLPGLALLHTFLPAPLPAWPVRLGLAWGLGVALLPLIVGLAWPLGIAWGRTAVWIYLALAALVLVWRAARRTDAESRKILRRSGAPLEHGLLALVLVATLIARLLAVRAQLVGANVDSYHHTLIVQLLLDNQGLFTSWAPYAPLETFSYHYGFHALAASAVWLTGASAADATLLACQLLLAATPLAAYTLAHRMCGPRAALWAALAVGLLNVQPAMYAFWGRATYVTGHLILAAVLVLWVDLVEHARARVGAGLIILTILATAGLALTHYQVALYAAIFVAIALALQFARPALTRADLLRTAGRALLAGTGAICLALPWAIHALGGNQDRNAANNASVTAGATFAGVALPPIVPQYLGAPFLLLAAIGLLLAARRRDRLVLLLGLWLLLTPLAAVPYVFGLPGTAQIEPDVALLALYVTALPLAASSVAAAQEWIEQRTARLAPLVVIALVIVGVLGGVAWQRDIVPTYVQQVTAADAAAFAWLRDNTATDARFAVQAHPIYGGVIPVGVDAGWWLPLLANRAVTIPPLTWGSERCTVPDCERAMWRYLGELRGRKLSDPRGMAVDLTREDALAELRLVGVTHIYAGAMLMQGPGTLPTADYFDREKLRASSAFRQIYAADGVEIFVLLP